LITHFILLQSPKTHARIHFHQHASYLLPFEIDRIRATVDEQGNLFVGFGELIGDRILLLKISSSEEHKFPEKAIVKWRSPGDNALFSYCTFYLVATKTKYFVVAASLGKANLIVMNIDFGLESADSISSFPAPNNSPVYYLRCEEELSDDEQDKEVIACLVGGVGVLFQKIKIGLKFDPVDNDLIGYDDLEVTKELKLPALRNYDFTGIGLSQKYALFKGNLGDYKMSEEAVKGTRLMGILMNLETGGFQGICPFGALWCDLTEYNNSYKLVSLTKERTKDRRNVTYLNVHRIYKRPEITILDDEKFHQSGELVKLTFKFLRDFPNKINIEFIIRNEKSIGELLGLFFLGVLFWLLVIIAIMTWKMANEKKKRELEEMERKTGLGIYASFEHNGKDGEGIFGEEEEKEEGDFSEDFVENFEGKFGMFFC
jgi:hypothetical protein